MQAAFALTPNAPPNENKRATKRRAAETEAPDPHDTVAFAAWCSKWKLDPGDPGVSAFATWHLGKGVVWRNWTMAWRDWEKKAAARGLNGHARVQSAPPGGGNYVVPKDPQGGVT